VRGLTDSDEEPTEVDQRRFVAALDTLPILTRTVFLLASRDDFSYPEIAWRCGISELEVQLRVGDGLLQISRHMDGRRRLRDYIRGELLSLREAWAASRAREGDRRLAPWLPPERRLGRRGVIDRIACAFERIAR